MTTYHTLGSLFDLLRKTATARDVRPEERCNSNVCRLIADAYRELGQEGNADRWQGIAELADAYQAYLTCTGRVGAVSAEMSIGCVFIVVSSVHHWKKGKRERLTRRYEFRVEEGRVYAARTKLLRAESPREMAEKIGDWQMLPSFDDL